jgi:hypothetical protein
MPSKKVTRGLYIATYVAVIAGIALCLLVTGYDLVQQTLALAHGGGRYFYIFILVGAYVATVSHSEPPLMQGHVCRIYRTRQIVDREKGDAGNSQAVYAY